MTGATTVAFRPEAISVPRTETVSAAAVLTRSASLSVPSAGAIPITLQAASAREIDNSRAAA
jgi:hypothetical protein